MGKTSYQKKNMEKTRQMNKNKNKKIIQKNIEKT